MPSLDPNDAAALDPALDPMSMEPNVLNAMLRYQQFMAAANTEMSQFQPSAVENMLTHLRLGPPSFRPQLQQQVFGSLVPFGQSLQSAPKINSTEGGAAGCRSERESRFGAAAWARRGQTEPLGSSQLFSSSYCKARECVTLISQLFGGHHSEVRKHREISQYWYLLNHAATEFKWSDMLHGRRTRTLPFRALKNAIWDKDITFSGLKNAIWDRENGVGKALIMGVRSKEDIPASLGDGRRLDGAHWPTSSHASGNRAWSVTPPYYEPSRILDLFICLRLGDKLIRVLNGLGWGTRVLAERQSIDVRPMAALERPAADTLANQTTTGAVVMLNPEG
ncbi:hypothetical protein B0H21DRAFT_713408 [Amylocystis lapponica]|nr:hypothetical protein B0H21DRAFT_713408 [Amylocystis lapponica]